MHFFVGVVSGRHSDQHFLNVSGFDAHLTAIQAGRPVQYWGYTDKGYGNFMANLFSAYHGPNVNMQQHIWNYMMSPLRVTVEWGFGALKMSSALLCKRIAMKTQMSPTTTLVKAAVLIYNTHTLLHGSKIGGYFEINCPFTVEAYFV